MLSSSTWNTFQKKADFKLLLAWQTKSFNLKWQKLETMEIRKLNVKSNFEIVSYFFQIR